VAIRIIVQNVSGIRNEIKNRTGEKKNVLRKLTSKDTDFLILTETKTEASKVKNARIKWGFQPKLYTAQNEPKGGVIIFSNPEYKLNEITKRESAKKGHYVMGIYEKEFIKIIVVGIYGIPENNDKESIKIYEEMYDHIIELRAMFNVKKIIIAGDFNAMLWNEDTNNGIIRKPRTTELLHRIIEELELHDIATLTNKLQHTWIRHNLKQSSRIDMIITNIEHQKIEYAVIRTIFDHACVATKIFQTVKQTNTPITTTDYIMVQEEFLIKAQEKIEECLIDEKDDDYAPGKEQYAQRGSQDAGRRALRLLNMIINELKKIHDKIWKHNKMKEKRELESTSQKLHDLFYRNKRSKENNNEYETEYKKIQLELKNKLEMKELAKESYIKNFEWNEKGKCEPVTFNCIREKKKKRKITYLKTEDNPPKETTKTDEIIGIMEEWYENTATRKFKQKIKVKDYVAKYDIELNKIEEEESKEIEDDITMEELEWALKNSKENSAPGPSGHTINFYKIIKLHVPEIMLSAINEIYKTPQILEEKENKWIQERKVVYINKKKEAARTPSDYRPLSMLEALYKIPVRIISKRINRVLPKIIGNHQHGFMQNKGIQEPIILATHAIQDANKNKKPIQIISLDMEKAFDRISTEVITQTMELMGFGQKTINAIKLLPLKGRARVEINGHYGKKIEILIGSGQGDPLSAIIFIIGIEPLNRVLQKTLKEHFFENEQGIKIGTVVYADDNLTTYNFQNEQQIRKMRKLYNEYTEISGLNINFNKSYAMCINTTEEVQNSIRQNGIEIVQEIKYLGVKIAKEQHITVRNTLNDLETKTVNRRILATIPTNDMLHKSRLINTACLPIYNHVFMTMPIDTEQKDKIEKEILKVLWTKQKEGQTLRKRKQVAKYRMQGRYEIGGLEIPTIEQHAEGLQMNLIQKVYKKIKKGENTMLITIIEQLLQQKRCPTIIELVERVGPTGWRVVNEKVKNSLAILGQAAIAIAKILEHEEKQKETWARTPIYGHTKNGIFQINWDEARVLDSKGIIIVEHLFKSDEHGRLTKEYNTEINDKMEGYQQIITKLENLHVALTPVYHKVQKTNTNVVAQYIVSNQNISRTYKKLVQEKIEQEIKSPPAYRTRVAERIMTVSLDKYMSAYKIIRSPRISSKTKEIAFQILNRTLWTNNKAYKSGKSETNKCPRCDKIETIEHLIADCDNYSYKIWEQLSQIITEYIKKSNPQASNIQLDFANIIYNDKSKNLQRTIKDEKKIQAISIIVQETKRDIYRRRQKEETIKKEEVHIIRRWAHIKNTMQKVQSYIQYLGERKWKQASEMMEELINIINDQVQKQ